MKKITGIFFLLLAGIVATIIINSCAATADIAAKSGSQLWGENCIRCHNAPSSADYSGAQWETIGMHMKLRANLTDDETKKIVAFLKSEN
jgi:cytochrome c1